MEAGAGLSHRLRTCSITLSSNPLQPREGKGRGARTSSFMSSQTSRLRSGCRTYLPTPRCSATQARARRERRDGRKVVPLVRGPPLMEAHRIEPVPPALRPALPHLAGRRIAVGKRCEGEVELVIELDRGLVEVAGGCVAVEMHDIVHRRHRQPLVPAPSIQPGLRAWPCRLCRDYFRQAGSERTWQRMVA